MTKLWILFAVSLALAYLIDYRERQFELSGIMRHEKLATWLLTAVLIGFCGIRVKGNDTTTYLIMFDQIPLWDDYWAGNTYDFAGGIGFGAIVSLLKTWGFSHQDFLMFFAAVTLIPYVMFVRRFSKSMMFGVFLMFTTGFYLFTLAAIKQCIATAVCLIAVGFAVDRKWLPYLLMMFLAIMLHPYAMVYLLVPLLMFKPWTTTTFIYIGVFVAVGFYLESLLGTVLDITDMMGANYAQDEFTGEGINIFRVLVSFAPLMLAVLCGNNLFQHSTRADDLMFNMAMINALIMFVGLFGTANYFARLANYFLPAQIITIPSILGRIHPKDRKWLVPVCVVGYLGYFMYENVIVHPFGYYYKFGSFWEYIVTLF